MNKTCGECRHCKDSKVMGVCEQQKLCLCPEELPACSKFEPKVVTNGDKIKQMSDEELAEFLSSKTICPVCPAQSEQCLGNASKVCKRNWLKWLNAPAESEGDDD